MATTVIDLDEEIVEQAMRVYGVRTRAAAVRAAMRGGVKLRLRRERFDAVDDGEFEDVFAETRSQTGPRNPDGSLKREDGPAAGERTAGRAPRDRGGAAARGGVRGVRLAPGFCRSRGRTARCPGCRGFRFRDPLPGVQWAGLPGFAGTDGRPPARWVSMRG